MGENSNSGLHRTFQISGNSNPVRCNEQNGKFASLSTDLGDNRMGCRISIVDIPYKSDSKNENPGSGSVLGENVEDSCRKDCGNGGECAELPNHGKPHIFNPERKDREMLFRGIDPLWDSRHEENGSDEIRISIEDKSESDAYFVFKCSNQEKIHELQSSLGKLFRDSTLDSLIWTKKTQEKPCYFVFQDDTNGNNDDSSSMSIGAGLNKTPCNNLPILVEKISESDSCRVATSLHLMLQSGDPQEVTMKELICYRTEVKRYGFNHIIIIGKRYCGMLFIDCYGRVFDWDSMNDVLWFLGDYFECISKESETAG